MHSFFSALMSALARSVVPCAMVATLSSSSALAQVVPAVPTVRIAYLVPADRVANEAYVGAIESAARNLQQWFGSQLGGATFRLHSTPVNTFRTSHPESFYAGDGAPGFGFWSRGVNDGYAAAGASAGPDTIWIFYLDAQTVCGQNGGAGAAGIALVSRDDLDGLLTGKPYNRCGEYFPLPKERWIGGLGHELGHALGLPHPPGCGTSAACDVRALMWSGYSLYPNTYLRADEKAQLASSRFLSAGWPTLDSDSDTLPDEWEASAALNRLVATGDDGAGGDPDKDGRSNASELAAGTHPRGFYTRFLAEGASGSFFATRLALLNPTTKPAAVLVRFQTGRGTTVRRSIDVPPYGRRSLDSRSIPDLAGVEFSTVIESDQLVVVERTMTWGASQYGAHAETSLAAPARTWYLAEGSTVGRFNLFYLIQNPGAVASTVSVTFLRPAPLPPLVRTYEVSPQSRFNIWVNKEDVALSATDVSAQITSTEPVMVERAMYIDGEDLPFSAGHASAGVTEAAHQWFLAEGATGKYFDLFVLIANPSDVAADITARFLLPDGTVLSKPHVVPARSRYNIWVDEEDSRLADTAVSTVISSAGPPVVVERSMWWPGTSATWNEAHNSAGATQTGTRWALSEGQVGGPASAETFILVANTSGWQGTITARLMFEDGGVVARTFPIAAHSRFNIAVASAFPEAVGRRFGALIESTGASAIQMVVERAMYSDAGGVRWAAGTNALATKLPDQ